MRGVHLHLLLQLQQDDPPLGLQQCHLYQIVHRHTTQSGMFPLRVVHLLFLKHQTYTQWYMKIRHEPSRSGDDHASSPQTYLSPLAKVAMEKIHLLRESPQQKDHLREAQPYLGPTYVGEMALQESA